MFLSKPGRVQRMPRQDGHHPADLQNGNSKRKTGKTRTGAPGSARYHWRSPGPLIPPPGSTFSALANHSKAVHVKPETDMAVLSQGSIVVGHIKVQALRC